MSPLRARRLAALASLLFAGSAAAAPPETSLSARLGARVTPLTAARNAATPTFRLALAAAAHRPLLTEPHANCHAVALRAGPDALTVIHRWDHTGEYDAAAVPWADIAADNVRYSLSSSYGGPRLAQPPDAPASPPPTPGTTLTGKGRTIRLLDAQKAVVWQIELPPGHTLIDFTAFAGLLFVATVSDQGARDGELREPYPTTQIFAIAQPVPGR